MRDSVCFDGRETELKVQVMELLALMKTEFTAASEHQLLHAKLLIQKLQIAGADFNDFKWSLFNIVGELPLCADLAAIMAVQLPPTWLDHGF